MKFKENETATIQLTTLNEMIQELESYRAGLAKSQVEDKEAFALAHNKLKELGYELYKDSQENKNMYLTEQEAIRKTERNQRLYGR